MEGGVWFRSTRANRPAANAPAPGRLGEAWGGHRPGGWGQGEACSGEGVGSEGRVRLFPSPSPLSALQVEVGETAR